MNKAELITSLQGLPDDAPIWLGVDTGDGFSQPEASEIFVCNATDAPVDGDECSDWEIEYVDAGKKIPKNKKGDRFLKIVDSDGTTRISGPIIVIGRRGAFALVDGYRNERENAVEIERENIRKRIELIKSQLEQAQKALIENGKRKNDSRQK